MTHNNKQKTISRSIRISLTGLLFVVLIACNFSTTSPQPVRLSGIPKEAFWTGGPDGGNWYIIKDIHSNKNTAHISIYNDQTAELIVSKKFMLICPADKQEFIKNLKEEIISFDGERIHLVTHCYLQ